MLIECDSIFNVCCNIIWARIKFYFNLNWIFCWVSWICIFHSIKHNFLSKSIENFDLNLVSIVWNKFIKSVIKVVCDFTLKSWLLIGWKRLHANLKINAFWFNINHIIASEFQDFWFLTIKQKVNWNLAIGIISFKNFDVTNKQTECEHFFVLLTDMENVVTSGFVSVFVVIFSVFLRVHSHACIKLFETLHNIYRIRIREAFKQVSAKLNFWIAHIIWNNSCKENSEISNIFCGQNAVWNFKNFILIWTVWNCKTSRIKRTVNHICKVFAFRWISKETNNFVCCIRIFDVNKVCKIYCWIIFFCRSLSVKNNKSFNCWKRAFPCNIRRNWVCNQNIIERNFKIDFCWHRWRRRIVFIRKFCNNFIFSSFACNNFPWRKICIVFVYFCFDAIFFFGRGLSNNFKFVSSIFPSTIAILPINKKFDNCDFILKFCNSRIRRKSKPQIECVVDISICDKG